MKTIYIYVILLFSFFTFAQVGIGTNNPNPSATLDVVSSSKGVKFPVYTLVDLTDDITPIIQPAESLLIYNSGGIHPTGFYTWINGRWNNVITKETVNISASAQLVAKDADNNLYPPINEMATNNKMDNYTSINTNTDNVTITPSGDITLPAGKYKINFGGDITVQGARTNDVTILATNNNKYYYRSYLTYLKDTAGNVLSPPQKYSTMFSQSFATVNWTHYIELTDTTTFNLFLDIAPDSNPDLIRPRTNITLIIYELKESI